MADAKTQLQSLLRIQDLALQIQAARTVVDGAPMRVEEVENRFRERNAEYVEIKERFDAIEADRSGRSLELATLEESRRHFQDSLMQVKNQREYAAALREIDAVKTRIADHEVAILTSMEEIETLKVELDGRAAHIEAERAIVEAERSQVEAAVTEALSAIDRAVAARADLEGTLPEALVANVRRVEEGRKGIFIVRADREMCSACHVRLRPQVYQEIKQAAKIHICGNCRRYLYFEAAVNGTLPSVPARTAVGPEVEAVNGGAV